MSPSNFNKNSNKPKPAFSSKKKEQTDRSETPVKREGLWPMRLNKYVAYCGIGSRRKAAEIVKAGDIEVNGIKEINPAVLISQTDEVFYQSKKLKPQHEKVYFLLNKPRGFITTTSDEKDRKTVMDLIKNQSLRIFPVGRLDKETTGLLLLTNDGDLAQKLMHPSHQIKKVYHVTLDKDCTQADIDKIKHGLTLGDGPALVDSVEFVQGRTKDQIGMTIHIGRNRIVRRIFEHLGYEVIKLDRVFYAGLTKKDLPRGRHRKLTDQELIRLKHFKML